MGRNGIGEAGATQLAECLRVNATLMSLDLSDNGVENAVATRLKKFLRANVTLATLYL